MKKKTLKVHNPTGLPTINYDKLKQLQGDLKDLLEENCVKLYESLRKYGYRVPTFVWQDDEGELWIEDAHQRQKVLRRMEERGWNIPKIPYVKIYAKDRKEAAEMLLQINSRYGVYNPETTFLDEFGIDLDFLDEIEIPELDSLLEESAPEIVEDEVSEPPAEPLSKMGDLWILGRHRVLCGDATKAEDVQRLMDGKKADVCFCDPPYGIDLDTNRFKDVPSQDFKTLKRNQYVDLVNDDILFNFTLFKDLSIKEQFWWGANYYCQDLPKGGVWFVWDKKKEGMENTLGGEFELCWSKQLHKSKILRILWTGFLTKEQDEKRVHPTQKPVKLCSWFLNKFSKENDIIADFFLGSGTTLIAAEQLNRICYGCEIDPHYVDVILDRYANFTNDDPVREADGMKWSELKKLQSVT